MFELFQNLDWPNLVFGAILSTIISGLILLGHELYGRYIISRDLPYSIWGIWYSAEFDPKGIAPNGKLNIDYKGHNTFLRVRVKRRFGRKVLIKVLGPFEEIPPIVPTKWEVSAKVVQGDTLVGTWRSTVPQTNRHGTAILRFLDFGRAAGYWTGSGPLHNPLYGYWVMCRRKDEVKKISKSFLHNTDFLAKDIASFVALYPPPSEDIYKS